MLTLDQITADVAAALKAVDDQRPRYKKWPEGIGAFPETRNVGHAVEYLRTHHHAYDNAVTEYSYPGDSRNRCDLVLPGEWAIEFKQTGVFMSRGFEADYWTRTLLHPFLGVRDCTAKSLAGDAIKLMCSGFAEKKAIILMHFERNPPDLAVELPVEIFEFTARDLLGVPLGERHDAMASGLVHPHHAQLRMFGWPVGEMAERRAVANPHWFDQEVQRLRDLEEVAEAQRLGIKVSSDHAVSHLRKNMMAVYGLDLRCYRGRRPVADDEKLRNIVSRDFLPGRLQISSRYKIKTIESRFKEQFGLTVQIIDDAGRLISDKLSLARVWQKYR